MGSATGSQTRLYANYYGGLLRRSTMSVAKGLALPLVRREAVRSGAHAMAYPISTYAPWQSDVDFGRIYQAVKANTLVDVWRCYELWSLLGELREIPGAAVEVGVWRGGSGALIAARMQELHQCDRVYLCDTWQGVVKTGPRDIYYHDTMHNDASKQDVDTLLRRLGLSNVTLLAGIFPDDTGEQVEAERLRLVHVDVDVYQSAKDAFDWAWPRLSGGGVAVFDDYGFPGCVGVTEFVDEQRGLPDRIVIHNLNGHGLVVKR